MDRGERDWRQANEPVYNPATYRGYYNRTPAQKEAEEAWRQYVPQNTWTHQGRVAWMGDAANYNPNSAAPYGPSYSGGGGGGYGGGGGGGGSQMTQAMFDSMMQALGTRAPQLTLSQVDLPDFTGTNVPAFNAQPYQQLTQNLATAVSRDQAAIQRGANQTTAALGAYSANPYAAAASAPPPQAQAQGAALEATAGGQPGGGANAQAAGVASADAGAETAAFNDLLKVLGGTYGAAQNSRMGQVQMDAQSARNQLGAQNLGLGAQIGMARNQGYEQWRQQDAERRYQNSMMSQQWNREEMTRNQDIANQQAQGRWQQGNEMIQNRLGPLLELLQMSGSGINTDALTQMLQGWAA